MLRKEDFMVIQALAKRGVYLTDIAAELGVHPKTVSRALKRGGPPSPAPKPRTSKLDPFKPTVDHLLAEGVWTSDYGRSQLRFVTHRHIGRAEVEQAVAAIRRVWERHAHPRARAVG